MEDRVKLKISLIISNRGNIRELLRDGYTYNQIAIMTNDLIDEKFIIEKENAMALSKKGLKWLSNKLKENKLKGPENWIVPEDRSRIKKLDKNEVYLPNRDDLSF